MPIRGLPNGPVTPRPQGGRDPPEQVVAINRNAWSQSIVTPGRDRSVCPPMVLDALIWMKNEVDSALTFRRSFRQGVCGSGAMNIDGANWLVCTRLISDTESPATIFSLASVRIIKDLVPDLLHVFAQCEMIELWFHPKMPEPEKERLQSLADRR